MNCAGRLRQHSLSCIVQVCFLLVIHLYYIPRFLRAGVSKIDIIFLFSLFLRVAFQGRGQSGFITLEKGELTALGNQYAGVVFWHKANMSVGSRKCPI